MRTIETLTTRQLATSLANQEVRNIDDSGKPAHLVQATDSHVEAVKAKLDAIVPGLFSAADPQALRSGQAATVQAEYLRQRHAVTV